MTPTEQIGQWVLATMGFASSPVNVGEIIDALSASSVPDALRDVAYSLAEGDER